ncbi:hypothetical protein SLS56_008796 [Neofusicoccum ribis]|uniref:Fungal specific transcription factor n=1 Tax=Neofusicoccum ribis TaxID=45134 RepID=A0ABR3SJ60_9PEZI
MPLGGERITSTSSGDVLGSRWGRASAAPQQHRPTSTPPQPPAQANGSSGDTLGSKQVPPGSPHRQASEPITSTIDDGDIIGRRWVPTIDRLSSTTAATAPLLTSRHATASPRPPAHHSATSSTPQTPATNGTTPTNPPTDLTKLKRLIDRLSWKSHTLLYTRHLALTSPAAATAPAQPTTMFKLDFFEYYTLLERVLVLVLAHFRVAVPKAVIGGDRSHRYHESVLEALERPGSPAHELLGRGAVRDALRRAKGFRNRWKGADERVGGEAWECQVEEVEELRLEEMVVCVLGALERVYRVAEEGGGARLVEGEGGGWEGVVDEDMEDAPWEVVGDAMEDVMDMDVE